MSRVAVLAGASGLVGGELLKILLEDQKYSRVYVLARKSISYHHPKLREMIIDFNQLEKVEFNEQIDDAYCCLGTTMKKAGSREAFYKVDFQYVVSFSEMALSQGASKFFLVSAVGANPNSIIYYNRIKGEVEMAVSQLKYHAIHIFRPSLLLGNRKEERWGEDIGKWLDKTFSFLIPERYKAIHACQVADAMLRMAEENDAHGVFIHESEQMRQISQCHKV
ncbi:MAG: oxidoreductase [Flammeovirgaceae bacterium]